MTRVLSDRDEQKLLNAVDKVSSKVDQGFTPSEAISEVCKDGEFNPYMAERLVTAYNVGAVLSEQDGNDRDTLSKLASLELADMGVVYEKAFSGISKKASCGIDPLYLNPYQSEPEPKAVSIEKQASYETSEFYLDFLNKKIAAKEKAEQAAEAAKEASMKEPLFSRMQIKAEYDKEFRKVASNLFNYEADLNAVLMKMGSLIGSDRNNNSSDYFLAIRNKYGSAGLSVLSDIIDIPEEIHAKQGSFATYEDMAPVYNCIDKVLDIVEKIGTCKATQVLLEETLKTEPCLKEAEQYPTTLSDFSKVAYQPDLKEILDLVKRNTTPKPFQISDLQVPVAAKRINSELNDPIHLNKLNAIKAKLTLTDLMDNDEVISGYDREEVLNSYNNLVNTVPGITLRPEILRTQLRSMLGQGGLGLSDLDLVTKLNYGRNAYVKSGGGPNV